MAKLTRRGLFGLAGGVGLGALLGKLPKSEEPPFYVHRMIPYNGGHVITGGERPDWAVWIHTDG